MRHLLTYLLIIVLFTYNVLGAVTPVNAPSSTAPDVTQLQTYEMAKMIQAQGEETRQYITDFGVETRQQFLKEKNAALSEIHAELVRFKFTLAITFFAAFMAAWQLHSIFHFRRQKKLNRLSREEVEAVQKRADPLKTSIPKSSPSISLETYT